MEATRRPIHGATTNFAKQAKRYETTAAAQERRFELIEARIDRQQSQIDGLQPHIEDQQREIENQQSQLKKQQREIQYLRSVVPQQLQTPRKPASTSQHALTFNSTRQSGHAVSSPRDASFDSDLHIYDDVSDGLDSSYDNSVPMIEYVAVESSTSIIESRQDVVAPTAIALVNHSSEEPKSEQTPYLSGRATAWTPRGTGPPVSRYRNIVHARVPRFCRPGTRSVVEPHEDTGYTRWLE